jgi:dTDP-4-amino-4,6-dideoxygalactose transaminase
MRSQLRCPQPVVQGNGAGIPSNRPFFSLKQIRWIQRALFRILSSGRLILGPYTAELERAFAAYVGTPHAVALSSCTAALEIALRFFGVKDREVIVPTNTFVASANAVRFAGGTPVLADIDPECLGLDLEDLERKLNHRTRAVIVVHIAGLVHPRLEEIRSLCRQQNVVLIEDVAHAAGATYRGRMGGTFGEAGCFSFYPTKVITTGTGGMLVTPQEDLADFARCLRHHGAGKQGLTQITHLGNDWLLDEVRAAIGLAQLREIERIIARRRAVAAQYHGALRGHPRAQPLPDPPKTRHVYYKYAVKLGRPEERGRLVDLLKSRHGIETGSIYYPPVHLQPLYAKEPGRRKMSFPKADEVLPRLICLPVHARMALADVQRVLAAFQEALEEVTA